MRIFSPAKDQMISEQGSRSLETNRIQFHKFINSAFRIVAGVILIIILWQVAALTVNKSIIPMPWEILRLIAKSLVSSSILTAAWQTIVKILLVLALSILIGIPVGLCLGISDTIYEICRPAIMLIQAVPVVSWLSLVIFAWGIGWKGPVFIASISLLPISILTTVSGVHNLDKNILEMAHLYQVPYLKIIKEIYLGSLMPFIASILDVSIGQAWKVILVTEYLCGGKGLGEEILMARMNIDFPGVWAVTLIAVFLGIVMERIVKFILRKISQRWMFV